MTISDAHASIRGTLRARILEVLREVKVPSVQELALAEVITRTVIAVVTDAGEAPLRVLTEPEAETVLERYAGKAPGPSLLMNLSPEHRERIHRIVGELFEFRARALDAPLMPRDDVDFIGGFLELVRPRS